MFDLIKTVVGALSNSHPQRRRRRISKLHEARKWRRQLEVESLEYRQMLSVDGILPGIAGFVFEDANGNGTLDSGETRIAGATVRLFEDNGDMVFDAATDTQVGADFLTLSDNVGTPEDETGSYCFNGLEPNATYFVVQPAQTIGSFNLPQAESPLLRPSVPGLVIDDFITTQVATAAPPPPSNQSNYLQFPDDTEVIGAERDLAVELIAGSAEVELRVNPFGLQDVLLFDSSAGTQGIRTITWDGQDADADALGFGLNGRDLTQSGQNTGIFLFAGVDNNGASFRFRLYQGDSSTFSEQTLPVPVTGGIASQIMFFPFSGFVGSVSPTNVDAIELVIETGEDSVDGQVDTIGALGPVLFDFANANLIDLELVKAVDQAIVDNGDAVQWTLTLTNNEQTASATATGVTVADLLPAGVTFVSATPSGNGTFDSATGVWTVVDALAPGDSASLIIVATVNDDVAGGTTLVNTAQVTAADQTDIDSTPNNDDGNHAEDDEDAASNTVSERIDLELTKTADVATAGEGDTVTWTVLLLNNADHANASATGITVLDTLPAGVTLVSATASGTGAYDEATGIWTVGEPLAPGATATLTLVTTVNVDNAGGAVIENSAQVTAADQTDFDSTPGNDDGNHTEDDEDAALVSVESVIDLELTKTADVITVSHGDTITWTITLTNNQQTANADATGVTVTDVLPGGVTLVSQTPSGTTTFADGVWTIVDPLAPGDTESLSLQTTVDDTVAGGTVLTNTAQVTSANETDIDSTPNNDDGNHTEDDEASADVTLNAVIDLELTKEVDSSVVDNGDTVTWTISLVNNPDTANTPATGVTVSDLLPAGVSLVNATTANGTFANGTWTLTAPLNPGDSATLTITSTVDQGVAGGTTITNVAQVASANEVDVDSTPDNDTGTQTEDDEDSASITLNSVIDLELDKSSNVSSAQTGDTLIWTITLVNNPLNANVPATGVTVTDILPGQVTLVRADSTNGSFANNTWTLASPLDPGATATLTLEVTINEEASGTSIINVAQVASANETDIDSVPGNDTGTQPEDDEDSVAVSVSVTRPPVSKRDLLASRT